VHYHHIGNSAYIIYMLRVQCLTSILKTGLSLVEIPNYKSEEERAFYFLLNSGFFNKNWILCSASNKSTTLT
jgi:hypothetical protein